MTFIKEELIRFRHCDPAGIAFYPRLFEMMNDLVEDWFEEKLGKSFKEIHVDNDDGVPAVNINCRFVTAVSIGDRIQKCLDIKEYSDRSITFSISFLRDGDTILTAEKTIANVDFLSMKSKPWCDHITPQLKLMRKND